MNILRFSEMIREDIVNFDRLRKSNILHDFIKNHNGIWNHQEWLDFCDYLIEIGYTPIDFNKVGELLKSL